MSIWTGAFWKATAERGIKTAAQTAVALLGVDVAGILNVDWVQTGSAVALATLLSVLTSVASGAVTDGTPSLANETIEQ